MVQCTGPCCVGHSPPPCFRSYWSAKGVLKDHANVAEMVVQVDQDKSKTSLIEAAASVFAKALSDESFRRSPAGIALGANLPSVTLGASLQLFTDNGTINASLRQVLRT